MIVFDLRCANAHVFEAWFGSSAAFEEQRARALVACPICGDSDIGKAAMAPNIAAKGDSGAACMNVPIDAVAVKAAMGALAAAQAHMLQKSEWVGRGFAGRARAMHAREETPALIHGEATIAEAKALYDEGVAVAALPFAVVPPEALN